MEQPEKYRYPSSTLVKKAVRYYGVWEQELYRWPKDRKVVEDGDGEVRIGDLQRWCNFDNYPHNRRDRWLTGDAIIAYLKIFATLKRKCYENVM